MGGITSVAQSSQCDLRGLSAASFCLLRHTAGAQLELEVF